MVFLCLGAALPVEARNVTKTQEFHAPLMRGVLLNWCKHAGRECGQPAADLFCSELGFDRASGFTHDPRAGARGLDSLIFGDGMICTGTHCQAFAAITCAKTRVVADPQPQPTPPQPQPQPTPPPTIPLTSLAPPVSAHPAPRPNAMSDGEVITAVLLLNLSRKGGDLEHCQSQSCEFTSANPVDVDLDGPYQTVLFESDLSTLPWAATGLWQVSEKPFPYYTGLDGGHQFDGLHLFGDVGAGVSLFSVNFSQLAETLGRNPQKLYVRVLPLKPDGAIAGNYLPSNVVEVLYDADAVPPDFTFSEISADPAPLFHIEVTHFEPPHIARKTRWGCVTIRGYNDEYMAGLMGEVTREIFPLGSTPCPEIYRGESTRIESFDDFLDWAVDGWDWLGDQYEKLQDGIADMFGDTLAVGCDLVMGTEGSFGAVLMEAMNGETGDNPTPPTSEAKSECRKYARVVAGVAVKTGVVALGLPPTIPSYNELIDRGVDYAV
ncbi:MAG: hypothetical protein GY945_05630, partial [Rhodobacteraceae bacterium]|nr:hypothetical protein [Paracoccaceae bacterium]